MISRIYEQVVELKNFFYDSGVLDSLKLPVPVISVGNLTLGGTGKTPFVDYLLGIADAKNLSAAVVSKNYRARSKGVQRVDIQRKQGAEYYGDESFMLARRHQNQKFWTGPQKFVTAQRAIQFQKPQLLIIDDGFQHRQLGRNLDILLIDVSVPKEVYHILPKGRMREGFENISRADLVVLTKINRKNQETYDFCRQKIEELQNKWGHSFDVIEAEYQSQLQKPLNSGERVLLVSGIAQPTSFAKSFEECREISCVDAVIADHLVYADHHPYSKSDFEKILRAKNELGCHRVVTTEKDFVKLQEFSAENIFDVMQVKIKMAKESQKIYEFFDKVHRI